jgi:small-conductance mechanosensitive channel
MALAPVAREVDVVESTAAQSMPEPVESSGSWLFDPVFTIGDATFSIATLLKLLVFILIVFSAANFARGVLTRRVFPRFGLEIGPSYALASIAFYGIVSLGLFVGLQASGIDLSSLTILLGALGVGVGFGLQAIASNFVSGLIILFERPVQVGDRVQIGSLDGRVTRIRMRATEILTNDSIVVIVPNSDFITQQVINWSRGGDTIRISVSVGVEYGSDVDLVRAALLEAAAAVPEALREPAPNVRLTGFGDSAIQFELLAWTREMLHRRGEFMSLLNYSVHSAFQRHGITIPFPQRDVHLRETRRPSESTRSL